MTAYTEAEKYAVSHAALQSISTGQSLRAFCITNKYPYQTVRDWLTEDEDAVNSAYARAKTMGTHYLAEECLDIADDLSKEAPPKIVEGNQPCDRVQIAKLRIDTRMRLIGKWNRKDYGDKVAHTGGDDGDAPIKFEKIEVSFVRPQPASS